MIKRTSIATAVAILVTCLAQVQSASANEWITQKIASGNYTLKYPSKPKLKRSKTPDGKHEFTALICEFKSAQMGVSCMPKEMFDDNCSNRFVQNMLDGLTAHQKSEVLFTNEIQFNGLEGADLGAIVVATNGSSEYFRQRMLLTETHVIQIIYVDKADRSLHPAVCEMFFNSLTKNATSKLVATNKSE